MHTRGRSARSGAPVAPREVYARMRAFSHGRGTEVLRDVSPSPGFRLAGPDALTVAAPRTLRRSSTAERPAVNRCGGGSSPPVAASRWGGSASAAPPPCPPKHDQEVRERSAATCESVARCPRARARRRCRGMKPSERSRLAAALRASRRRRAPGRGSRPVRSLVSPSATRVRLHAARVVGGRRLLGTQETTGATPVSGSRSTPRPSLERGSPRDDRSIRSSPPPTRSSERAWGLWGWSGAGAPPHRDCRSGLRGEDASLVRRRHGFDSRDRLCSTLDEDRRQRRSPVRRPLRHDPLDPAWGGMGAERRWRSPISGAAGTRRQSPAGLPNRAVRVRIPLPALFAITRPCASLVRPVRPAVHRISAFRSEEAGSTPARGTQQTVRQLEGRALG